MSLQQGVTVATQGTAAGNLLLKGLFVISKTLGRIYSGSGNDVHHAGYGLQSLQAVVSLAHATSCQQHMALR